MSSTNGNGASNGNSFHLPEGGDHGTNGASAGAGSNVPAKKGKPFKANPHRVTEVTIEQQENRRKALELRKAGATYREIATELGYAAVTGAYKCVQAAFADIIKEPGEEVIKLELERLDTMLRAHWPKTHEGWEIATTDLLLRIMDRRARLLGINAPQKTEINANITSLSQHVSLIAEAAKSDDRLRDLILELDERIRLGGSDSQNLPGALRSSGN